MNQRRNRRRAGHRIRQPNIQRYLRALAGRADEKQNGDRRYAAGKDRVPGERIDGWHAGDGLQRAGHAVRGLSKKLTEPVSEEDQHDAQHETPVADAIRDECFLGRVARFLAIDVVTNQQVGAKAHAFPTDKHQQEVVGQHQRQHREHEQVEKCEEAIEAFVLVHVADRKTWIRKPTKVMNKCVGAAQPIHRQAEVRAKLSDLNPGPEMIEHRLG